MSALQLVALQQYLRSASFAFLQSLTPWTRVDAHRLPWPILFDMETDIKNWTTLVTALLNFLLQISHLRTAPRPRRNSVDIHLPLAIPPLLSFAGFFLLCLAFAPPPALAQWCSVVGQLLFIASIYLLLSIVRSPAIEAWPLPHLYRIVGYSLILAVAFALLAIVGLLPFYANRPDLSWLIPIIWGSSLVPELLITTTAIFGFKVLQKEKEQADACKKLQRSISIQLVFCIFAGAIVIFSMIYHKEELTLAQWVFQIVFHYQAFRHRTASDSSQNLPPTDEEAVSTPPTPPNPPGTI
jgi:hypothetical protein